MKKSIIILVLSLTFLGYKFFMYKKYTENLKFEIEILKEYIIDFSFAFHGLYPRSKADLIRIIKCHEFFFDGPVSFSILENGFNVQHDKNLNKFVIYGFGENKKDDQEFNEFNSKEIIEVDKLSLFDYVFSFKSDDIIVTVLDIPELNCDYLLDGINAQPIYQIYNEKEYLKNNEDYEKYQLNFGRKVLQFARSYCKQNRNISHDFKSYVMYRDAKLEFVCTNNKLTNLESEKIIKDLNEYLVYNEMNIEYALFPLKFQTSDPEVLP